MESSTDVLVSVLVPICNVEKYLTKCLVSLDDQTYKNLQIICINDGSTDGSKDIIDSFMARDSRFQIIDKPNSGYGDSMNKGLEAAQGKYISILESDDFLDAEAIEYMVGEAERQELDVFKCNFWLYWSEGQPEYSYRNDVYFELATPDMINLGVHEARMYPAIFWQKASIWSALYSKKFLDENGIRFLPTPGASYQDASFTFKVYACAQRVAYSGRAFLHYRQDNENSSVNSKGKVYCTCDEHAEMTRFLNEDRPDLKTMMDPIRAHLKFVNYAWNYNRLADQFKGEFLDRFADEMLEEVALGNVPEGCLFGDYFNDPEIACQQYFNEGQAADLRLLITDKRLYAAKWASLGSSSKLQTMGNFFTVGGPELLVKLFDLKLKGEI